MAYFLVYSWSSKVDVHLLDSSSVLLPVVDYFKPVSAVSSSVTRALVEIREQLTRATAAMGRMLGNIMDFQVKSSREAAEMPAEVREDTRKA